MCSPVAAERIASSARTSGSRSAVSTSTHWYGTWLRARKSRISYAPRVPARAEDADAGERRPEGALPVAEEVVEDGIELAARADPTA